MLGTGGRGAGRRAWRPGKKSWKPPSGGVSDGQMPVASLIFAAVLMMALAVGLSTKGIQELGVSADLDHRGISAAANVVEVKHESANVYNGGTREWTMVTVAFADVAGTERQATHEGRTDTHVGDRLTIVYDPRNPMHVRWDSDVDETDLDLGLGAVFAVLALGITIRAAIVARRRRPSTAITQPTSDPDVSGSGVSP